MYQIIRAGQIKAARAILDWSQEDLASASGLALNTIRNLESGFISPREKTVTTLRQAVEKAGLEFIEPDGVRRRVDEVKVLDGPDSCEDLLNDLIQTARKYDGEIAVITESREMMGKFLGVSNGNNIDRLERLKNAAVVKCLLFDTSEPPFPVPQFQFRTTPMGNISPTPYFVYGDKHALVMNEGSGHFRFVVFTWPSLAHSYRAHFHALWKHAEPVMPRLKAQKQRA
ncbi:MAG: helix-turn-helix domain-containing protein [Alphaproteobacteria bacterium]|nr:helix-turn-helix domain-containing protein [Alphaproteobacteria bacterium]